MWPKKKSGGGVKIYLHDFPGAHWNWRLGKPSALPELLGAAQGGGLQLWFTEETAAAPGWNVLPLTALALYLLIDLRKGLGPGCTRH